jgi:hypothetical protein
MKRSSREAIGDEILYTGIPQAIAISAPPTAANGPNNNGSPQHSAGARARLFLVSMVLRSAKFERRAALYSSASTKIASSCMRNFELAYAKCPAIGAWHLADRR